MPLGGEFGVVEDFLDESAADAWAHGVFTTNEVTEVVDDAFPNLGRAGGHDEVKGAGALAIETEILGEALRNADLHVRLVVEEIAHRPRVIVGGTGGKTLVGRVKEGEQALLLTEVSDCSPLIAVGIEAGRIVGAGVQEDHIAGLSFGLEGSHHAIEVQGAIGRVIVRVGLDIDTREFPDGHMVGPGRIGQPDVLWLRMSLEEQSADVVGAGAGDSLHRGDSALGFWGAILSKTEHQIARDLKKGNVSFDGGIFMAEDVVFRQELFLGFLDDGERPGLAIVGSVDTHTQVDLVRIRIFGVGAVQSEDLIGSNWVQGMGDGLSRASGDGL